MAGDTPHHARSNCYTGSEAELPIGPALEEGELHEQADARVHNLHVQATRTPASAIQHAPARHRPMGPDFSGSIRAKLMEMRHRHAEARNATSACARHTPAILFPDLRMDFSPPPPRMGGKGPSTNNTPKPNTNQNPRRETEDEDEQPAFNPAEVARAISIVLPRLERDINQFSERMTFTEDAILPITEQISEVSDPTPCL